MKDLRNIEYSGPKELINEDVYEFHYLFENIYEAIKLVSTVYLITPENLIEKLFDDFNEAMRFEFGKERFLRSIVVGNTIHLSELMSGEYILWESY